MPYDSAIASNVRLDKRRPLVPNGVLGMLVFVVSEVMFFMGLISAFVISKSNVVGGWPPVGQPRLPVLNTAFNTTALLASGALLFFANRAFIARQAPKALRLLFGSLILGAFFVGAQGVEWIALIRDGLTIYSGMLGQFFYLIVGVHALHALVALGILAWTYWRLRDDRLEGSAFWPAQIFWYFVVGIWPILYWLVYL
jgi:heme/copper-type cytochrome/quinol oxidase subunit 3